MAASPPFSFRGPVAAAYDGIDARRQVRTRRHGRTQRKRGTTDEGGLTRSRKDAKVNGTTAKATAHTEPCWGRVLAALHEVL
jgi:hypothetical protein